MTPFEITRIQPRAWSILARSAAAGRYASAYLFHGPDGAGHWSLALTLAALLNCENPGTPEQTPGIPEPCGRCGPCRMVQAVNFPGLYCIVPVSKHKKLDEAIELTNEVIESKRQEPFRVLASASSINIPVEMVREVQRSLSRRPDPGVTRVLLIYHLERMRQSSADALLKLIEEPPPQTVIVLTTPYPDRLLPTVLSRCQKIRLTPVGEAFMVGWLQRDHGVSEKQARIVSRITGGVPGRALELIDDSADEELSRRSTAFLAYKTLFGESTPPLVNVMMDVSSRNDRGAAEELLRQWQGLIRDCAYYAATADDGRLTNIDYLKDISRLSTAFGDPALAGGLVEIIKNTLADLERNVHIQLALVAMALKLRSYIRASAGNPAG